MSLQNSTQPHIDYIEHPSPSPPPLDTLSSSHQIEHNDIMLEDQLKFILCALLKSSDDYGLRKTTKFLARFYCLTFLSKFPNFCAQNPQLLMISSLRLAVKFNQNNQLSSNYTIECCVNQSRGFYSPENFITFEQNLLKGLQYRLYAVSPYDIHDQMAQKFQFQAIQREIVQASLDFILTLSQFAGDSGQELYAICLLGAFQQRKIQNIRLFHYLENLMKRFPEAIMKASLIKNTITSMEEESQCLNQ